MKNLQIIIGIILILLGVWQIFSSTNIPEPNPQGITLGMGAIMVFWGIREIVGAIIKCSARKQE